ncbi:MAG: hypothetical protein PF961_22380 [Planctomycetota bacterium]|jgi:hypothetical protein|nr:hypothetical protein [Planctomycetota bacterium]
MRLCTTLACLFLATAAMAVDLSSVPKEHRWVLHLDVKRTLAGEIGVWLDQMAAEPQTRARLDLLQALTGVTIREHLHGITVSGPDQNEADAVVMLHGQFDAQRITTLAAAADGHQATAYGAHQIHRWLDKDKGNKEQFGALAGEVLLIGNSAHAIQRSLDVLDGKAASLADDPSFANLAKVDAAIVAGAAVNVGQWQGLDAQAAMLKEVDSITALVNEVGPDLKLALQLATRDEQKAMQMQQVGQGLIALYALGQVKDIDPNIARLLQGLQIQRDGATLSVATSFPVAELRRIVEERRAGKQAAHAEAAE